MMQEMQRNGVTSPYPSGLSLYPQSHVYDESMMARGSSDLADISKSTMTSASGHMIKVQEGLYAPYGSQAHMQAMGETRSPQMALPGYGPPPPVHSESMLGQLASPTIGGLAMQDHGHSSVSSMSHHAASHMYSPAYSHPSAAVACQPPAGMPNHMSSIPCPHPGMAMQPSMTAPHQDLDCDPRELEAFAERFKQRRIKLGVTQADVGNALGKLKIPGVGRLSQSTICRFESLTLSHNNMIALKPVLVTWLEEAEKAAREAQANNDVLNGLDQKRKRTSIAAPEKRSLEAYFAVQPRPSGEKIAQIAEKLDLKKSVVRVWFCNQRQKQKRMKFSAINENEYPRPHSITGHL